MRIAIYGGSFNPPHAGHIHVAKKVSETLEPDVFYIIPDYLPPHKMMAKGSALPQQRLEMCRIAFENIENARVSDMELKRKGRSYTSDTIAKLREEYPEDEIYLVIGTDMLTSFTTWHMFEYLLEQCTLVVLSREEDDSSMIDEKKRFMEDEYGAKIVFIECEAVVASSTDIRDELLRGEKPEELPEEVYEYIKEEGLYRNTDDK